MSEILSALAVFALLCAAAGLGLFAGKRLPEHHRTRESVELMQLTIGMLATFAAIVLGLLTASVKQSYDDAERDRQQYALTLDGLDACLQDVGAQSAAARADIHSYVAAVIASTWPNEPPPRGVSYPDTSNMPLVGAAPTLERLMERVGVEVSRLNPSDPSLTKIVDLCRERYRDVARSRLSVIEDVGSELFDPFYQVLVFWLMIMFACFGLVAPRNSLSFAVIAMSAVSLSSVMFVIVDLSRPYGSFFGISSESMRTALTSMLNRAP